MEFDKTMLELLAKCAAFASIGNAVGGFILHNIGMAILAIFCAGAWLWWMHLLKAKNGKR